MGASGGGTYLALTRLHDGLQAKMEELKRGGIFFCLTFTVMRVNFDTVTVGAGC